MRIGTGQRKQQAERSRSMLRRLAIERATLQSLPDSTRRAALEALANGLAILDREKTPQELAEAASVLQSPPFERQGKLL